MIKVKSNLLLGATMVISATILSGCTTEFMSERKDVPPAEQDLNSAAERQKAQQELKMNEKSTTTPEIIVDFKFPKMDDMSKEPIYSNPTKTSTSKTSSGNYTVVSGDSLSRLSARFNVKLANLAKANNLTTKSHLYVGQKLVIPGKNFTSRPATSTTTKSQSTSVEVSDSGLYTIRGGDTISGIASKFNVKQSDIFQANNLTPTSVLRIGATIKIPGKSVTINEQENSVSDLNNDTSSSTNDVNDDVSGILNDFDNEKTDTATEKVIESETTESTTSSESVPPVEILQDKSVDDFAKENNVTVEELAKLNHIPEDKIFKKGIMVFLPNK